MEERLQSKDGGREDSKQLEKTEAKLKQPSEAANGSTVMLTSCSHAPMGTESMAGESEVDAKARKAKRK